MSLKAIIFDMDGVLFDTEPLYMEKRKQYFEYCKMEYNEKELECLVGLNLPDALHHLFPKLNTTEIENLIKGYREYPFENEYFYIDSIFEDVIETLTYLASLGLKIVVASSSPKFKIEAALQTTGLQPIVDFYVTGDMFQQSKPNPEIYNYTKRKLGFDTSEILVVEDSKYGVEAALKANLQVVQKRNDLNSEIYEGPIHIISTLKEIISITEGMLNEDNS